MVWPPSRALLSPAHQGLLEAGGWNAGGKKAWSELECEALGVQKASGQGLLLCASTHTLPN